MIVLGLIGRTVRAPGRQRLGLVVDAWDSDGRGGEQVVVRWEPLSEFEQTTCPWSAVREVEKP